MDDDDKKFATVEEAIAYLLACGKIRDSGRRRDGQVVYVHSSVPEERDARIKEEPPFTAADFFTTRHRRELGMSKRAWREAIDALVDAGLLERAGRRLAATSLENGVEAVTVLAETSAVEAGVSIEEFDADLRRRVAEGELRIVGMRACGRPMYEAVNEEAELAAMMDAYDFRETGGRLS